MCFLKQTNKVEPFYLFKLLVGTEDMDALTFGGEVLLRHLTFSEARKMVCSHKKKYIHNYKRVGLGFGLEYETHLF